MVRMDAIEAPIRTPKARQIDVAGGESYSNSPPSSHGPKISHIEDAWHWHADHAPPIDRDFAEKQYGEDYKHQPDLWWSRTRHRFRDLAAEFCQTFTMAVLGDGSVARVVLRGYIPRTH